MRRIDGLWVLFFFLHTACSNYKQVGVESEADTWGAIIAINANGVESKKTINGFPVLELSGTISKNVPGAAKAVLCALFVPDGQAVADSTKEVQSHQVGAGGRKMQELHQLANGSFVYYERELNAGEEVPVNFNVSSLDPAHRLALGTTYKVYLAVKVGGHVYFDEQASCSYILPPIANIPVVTMDLDPNHTKCERRPAGLGFYLKADLAQLKGFYTKSGFLLIKQGEALTGSDVLARTEDGDLPTNSDEFKTHPGYENVVICSYDSLVKEDWTEFKHADLNPAPYKPKGGMYDVYGYIKNGTNYFVSIKSEEIEIPAVEMDISMQIVEDPVGSAVFNSMGICEVEEFTVKVKGKIDKIKDPEKPIAGFLFADASLSFETLDQSGIGQAIENCGSNSADSVIEFNNKQQVIYIRAGELSAAEQQDGKIIKHKCDLKKYDSEAHLEFGKDYKVYFWVKDAQGKGELFLSPNPRDLKVLHVSGGIKNVDDRKEKDSKGATTKFYIDVDAEVDITNYHRNGGDIGPEISTLFLSPDDENLIDLNGYIATQTKKREKRERVPNKYMPYNFPNHFWGYDTDYLVNYCWSNRKLSFKKDVVLVDWTDRKMHKFFNPFCSRRYDVRMTVRKKRMFFYSSDSKPFTSPASTIYDN